MKISILFLLFAVLSVANMCTQKSNNVLYVMAHTYCAYSYSSEKNDINTFLPVILCKFAEEFINDIDTNQYNILTKQYDEETFCSCCRHGNSRLAFHPICLLCPEQTLRPAFRLERGASGRESVCHRHVPQRAVAPGLRCRQADDAVYPSGRTRQGGLQIPRMDNHPSVVPQLGTRQLVT